MIGRLVEQQHLGCDGQGLSQRQALFLAAGKAADIGLRVEPETVDDLLGLRLVGPGAAGFQLMLQGFHLRQQGIVIARAFGHPVRHIMVGRKQP